MPKPLRTRLAWRFAVALAVVGTALAPALAFAQSGTSLESANVRTADDDYVGYAEFDADGELDIEILDTWSSTSLFYVEIEGMVFVVSLGDDLVWLVEQLDGGSTAPVDFVFEIEFDDTPSLRDDDRSDDDRREDDSEDESDDDDDSDEDHDDVYTDDYDDDYDDDSDEDHDDDRDDEDDGDEDDEDEDDAEDEGGEGDEEEDDD